MTIETLDVSERLKQWAADLYGIGASVEDVRPMPGNAGLSFGFVLRRAGTDPLPLVVRLAPPGVRRQGNTDVLRQVPLLNELHRQGAVPVARIHWWSDEERWFGTPGFISELLPGRPLHVTSAELSYAMPDDGGAELVLQAVDMLAVIHRTPIEGVLANWAEPRTPRDELEWSMSILRRSENEDAISLGAKLAADLRDQVPAAFIPVLVHGDYQPNNILYRSGAIAGVVDWELAGIGAGLLDLGWLTMMTDRSCWESARAAKLRVPMDPNALQSRYAQASELETDDLWWYLGLACLRFGAIIAYNLRLHRTGKRIDETFEELALSLPILFERGRASVAAHA
jgi:aminoglycoside phosphotransferase (APT) family kinase protein